MTMHGHSLVRPFSSHYLPLPPPTNPVYSPNPECFVATSFRPLKSYRSKCQHSKDLSFNQIKRLKLSFIKFEVVSLYNRCLPRKFMNSFSLIFHLLQSLEDLWPKLLFITLPISHLFQPSLSFHTVFTVLISLIIYSASGLHFLSTLVKLT